MDNLYQVKGPYKIDKDAIKKIIDSSPAAEHLRRMDEAMMALNYLRMIRMAFATNPAGLVIAVLIEITMALVNFFINRRAAQQERERLARLLYEANRRRERKLKTYEGRVTIASEDYQVVVAQLQDVSSYIQRNGITGVRRYWYNRTMADGRRLYSPGRTNETRRLEGVTARYEKAEKHLQEMERQFLENLRINYPPEYYYRTEQITNLEYLWMIEHNVDSLEVMRRTFRESRVYNRVYGHGVFGEPEYLFFDHASGLNWEIREYLLNYGYITISQLGFMRREEIHTLKDLHYVQGIRLFELGYITWEQLMWALKNGYDPYDLLTPQIQDKKEPTWQDILALRLRVIDLLHEMGYVSEFIVHERLTPSLLISRNEYREIEPFSVGLMNILEQNRSNEVQRGYDGIPTNILENAQELQAWLLNAYYEHNLIDARGWRFMTDNGFYSPEQLRGFTTTPPHPPVKDTDKSIVRSLLLKNGLITKEEYALMKKHGVYRLEHLRKLENRLAQEEHDRKIQERENKRMALFRSGKIDKEELQHMRAFDYVTLEELRKWQSLMEGNMPGIGIPGMMDKKKLYEGIKKIEEIWKDPNNRKGYTKEIDKNIKDMYELADKIVEKEEQIKMPVIPDYVNMPITDMPRKPKARKPKAKPEPEPEPEEPIQQLTIPEFTKERSPPRKPKARPKVREYITAPPAESEPIQQLTIPEF